VIGESAAGRAFDGKLGAGQAVRIFTGAPMPEGADAVLMQEDAERQAGVVLCRIALRPGDNVRVAGIDFRERAPLLQAGTRLSPRDVALAAAANHATLLVRRAPKVAVLATGDELVPPGAPIAPAQIVASNNFVIKGIVTAAGGLASDLGIAPDNREKLAAAMAQGAGADVLVTLGGASVGDYDLVQEVLKGQGLALDFWRIAMRPGKPLMLGRLKDQIVLGLPGNPASSFVCALLFLQPLLRALLGDPAAGADPSAPAFLGVDAPPNGPRQDYVRVRLRTRADGALEAEPAGDQDSSLIGVMAKADGLLIRAPHAPAAAKGEACRVIRFAPLGA
jgi:molybdopterin molybdotransferase